MSAHLAAVTTDNATAYAILIAAVAAAVVSVVTAWQGRRQAQQAKLPSNTVTPGAAAENTAIALGLLTHLLADIAGKRVTVPTPVETQELVAGATLASPPAPPVPAPPPGPPGSAP